MKHYRQIVIIAILMLSLCLGSVYSLSVDGVTPINNRDYGPAMLKLLQNAQKNIKIMLYQAGFYKDFPDTISNKFVEEIGRAVKRGVYVIAIIDVSDWNPDRAKYNKEFGEKLIEAGAEVYLDDPTIVSHQKVVLIDDFITVVGSVNWSYYSLDRNNEVAAIIWSTEVNKAYTDYFNKRLAEAERFLPKGIKPNLEIAKNAGFNLLPAKSVQPANDRLYFLEVHRAISQAKQRVWVAQMSAYYYMIRPKNVPSDVPTTTTVVPALTNLLLKDLIKARERGLDVKVILDIQKDRDIDNMDFANRLIAAGVPVYFDDPEVTLHAKMVLIDDHLTVIGSTNWTLNALELGHEASVVIDSREVNQVYSAYFQELLKTAKPVTASSEFHPSQPQPAEKKVEAENDL